MKRLIRETLILLFGWLGITWWYRHKVQQSGPVVRVLCFHDIPDQKWFSQLLDMFQKRYHLLTPAEFSSQDFQADKINVLLTFDDGYQSWVERCLPELEKRDLIGVFFLNSGLLDSHNTPAQGDYVKDRLRVSERNTLSWEGARKLVSSKQVVGGHTVGHFDLTSLDREVLEEEIRADKEQITNQVGVTPEWFAYPFGTKNHYNKEVKEVVGQYYPVAFVAWPSFYQSRNHHLEIPRICLEQNQSTASVRRWIEGGYDLVYRVKYADTK